MQACIHTCTEVILTDAGGTRREAVARGTRAGSGIVLICLTVVGAASNILHTLVLTCKHTKLH